MKCKNCDHDLVKVYKYDKWLHRSSRKNIYTVLWCDCNKPEPKEVENEREK